MNAEDMERMVQKRTERASNFLKAISHEGRLMILCHLASGEKSVTELEELLSARQAAVSQQLYPICGWKGSSPPAGTAKRFTIA